MELADYSPLRWFRFDLRSLLSLVALIAFGLTALKFSTRGWSIAMTTIVAGTLLYALFRAIFRRDAARPFWLGFVIGGSAYFLVLYADMLASQTDIMPENDLLTAELLDVMFRKYNPESEKLIAEVGSYRDGSVFRRLSMSDSFSSTGPTVFSPPGRPDPAISGPTDDASGTADGSGVIPAVVELTGPELIRYRAVYFPRIGHCLFALIIGWVGGWLASGFSRPERKEESAGPEKA